jgi:serine protease inhibitor
MKSTILPLSLFAVSLIFFQCKKADDPTPQPGIEFSCDDSPVTCDLTAANGVFAFDIFKKLHNDAPAENMFISPFSISTALTMTVNGANGQTFGDMRNTLKINDLGMPDVNGSYKQLLEVLPALDPQTKLKLANSIWPQLDYPVLQSFLDLNKEFFNSEVVPVDFKDPAVIGKVNQWVEDNTNGLIKETLQELPSGVVMLLINAIYFKGAWQTEFDAQNTHPADFHTAAGPVQVDMMHIPESDFAYFSNEMFQMIDLPYGDSIFSMTILLPKEGHTVNDVINQMNAANWKTWLAGFQTQPVQLFMPKFKMEYGVKLKRPLSDLGMGVAFSDFADFTKMIDGGGVKIDDVIHKAFVEVNEEGTEAAAVTVVIIIETSVGSMPTVNVNKPFVFVIRDNRTNSLLFMGKMMTPEG